MKLLTKLFLLFIPLAILLIGASLVTSRRGMHRILVEEAHNRGLAQISGNKQAFSRAFESGTETALLPLLQALKEQTQGARAAALDRTGRVLAHTNVLEKDKTYADTLTAGMLRSDLPVFRETAGNGGAVLEVSAPVWSEKEENADFLLSAGDTSRKQRLGTIILGLPLSRTIRLENRLFARQTALLVLAAAGLSLGLLFFVIRAILRPARRLADGIAKVSAGRCCMFVPVTSNDELGQLTGAFNRMAENLEKTTVSRDELSAEVAERKKAEAELLQLLSLHHAILESTADGILVVGLDGRVVAKNRKFTQLWRIPDDIAASKDDEKLLACVMGQLAAPEEFIAEVKRLYAHPGRESFDTLTFKDGRIFERLSQPQKIGGRIVGRVWNFRDITERRKLEAAMLQSEKLSAVGQLAAGVAHEINNPLGIILGFAQSVRKRINNEGDPLALPLKTIEREAVRCKDLVRNLLAFSRSSKNSRPEDLDLNAAVEGALSLISARTKTCNVELALELGADLPKIHANNNQLQQVVVNLANNAIDAMPKGGTLTVRTALSARRPGYVDLRVHDTGGGIPAEIHKKIFEPFFTTKEVGKGTGLGLSLVYEIVHKHGGTVELESEEGKGTTFTVFLPVRSAAMPAAGAS